MDLGLRDKVAMVAADLVTACGLGLQELSPALSFAMMVDEAGNLQDVEIVPTLLRVTRLSYEDVDTRLDLAQMPAHGQCGAGQAQEAAKQQQAEAAEEPRRGQAQRRTVQAGQRAHRPGQTNVDRDQQQYRHQPAAESLQNAPVQERPADEGIGTADEFGDLDFRPPVEDGQANGVAGHQHHAGAKQPGHHPHRALAQLQQGVQAPHPVQVGLHVVDLRQRAQPAGEAFERCLVGGGLRGQHQRRRQWILAQQRQGLAQAGTALELGQRLGTVDQGHIGLPAHILAQIAGQGAGIGIRQIGFQIGGEARVAVPSGRGLAQRSEAQQQARRQGQTDADHQRR